MFVTLVLVMVVLVTPFDVSAATPSEEEHLYNLLVDNYGANDWNDAELRARFEQQEPNFFTVEYQETISEIFNRPNRLLRAGETKTLSVPLIQQANDHYCGVASVAMVADYFGPAVAQSTIASAVGYVGRTNGLYMYEAVSGLQKYGTNAYTSAYVGGSTSQGTFTSIVMSSIRANNPVLALVYSPSLGPKYGTATGHYVCLTGFQVGTGSTS